MSSRQQRKLERAKRDALRSHALNYDLDPELDYCRAGNRPSERAFELLSCGFDMVVVMMDSAFPSLDRGASKTGSKWAREALLWSGVHAGGFMARASAALLARMRGRLGEDAADAVEAIPDPEFHMSLRRSVEDFYPRIRNSAAEHNVVPLLEACEAEFDVMEKGKPREEVSEGDQPANEFSLALMRGEDPRDNPELLEEQRLYARDYFIHRAALGGVQTLLFLADVRRLFPKLIPFLDPSDPRLSDYRRRALAAWVEGSRQLREYALIEYQNADRSRKPQWTQTGTS
jgi:hypothetical protein